MHRSADEGMRTGPPPLRAPAPVLAARTERQIPSPSRRYVHDSVCAMYAISILPLALEETRLLGGEKCKGCALVAATPD
jgi:hypothetical protein